MSTEIIIKKVLEPFLANWPLILAFVAIVLVLKILRSARFKGWLGERLVNRGLARLDPTIYRTFHDLYIPRPDGQGTTQQEWILRHEDVRLDATTIAKVHDSLQQINRTTNRTTNRKAAARQHRINMKSRNDS